MARFIAQIIILGGQVIGRAFAKALRQEFQSGAATQRASSRAQEGAKRAAANSVMGVSLQEAKQILNVQDVDPELIQKRLLNENKKNINRSKQGRGRQQVQVVQRLDNAIHRINPYAAAIETQWKFGRTRNGVGTIERQNYDHLFKINEKKAGGSFYLQSKVVRAKERLDEELRMQEKENVQEKQTTSESET